MQNEADLRALGDCSGSCSAPLAATASPGPGAPAGSRSPASLPGRPERRQARGLPGPVGCWFSSDLKLWPKTWELGVLLSGP